MPRITTPNPLTVSRVDCTRVNPKSSRHCNATPLNTNPNPPTPGHGPNLWKDNAYTRVFQFLCRTMNSLFECSQKWAKQVDFGMTSAYMLNEIRTFIENSMMAQPGDADKLIDKFTEEIEAFLLFGGPMSADNADNARTFAPDAAQVRFSKAFLEARPILRESLKVFLEVFASFPPGGLFSGFLFYFSFSFTLCRLSARRGRWIQCPFAGPLRLKRGLGLGLGFS